MAFCLINQSTVRLTDLLGDYNFVFYLFLFLYFIFIFIFVFLFFGGEGFLVRAIEYIASPDVNTNKGVGEMATPGAVSANPLLLFTSGDTVN